MIRSPNIAFAWLHTLQWLHFVKCSSLAVWNQEISHWRFSNVNSGRTFGYQLVFSCICSYVQQSNDSVNICAILLPLVSMLSLWNCDSGLETHCHIRKWMLMLSILWSNVICLSRINIFLPTHKSLCGITRVWNIYVHVVTGNETYAPAQCVGTGKWGCVEIWNIVVDFGKLLKYRLYIGWN